MTIMSQSFGKGGLGKNRRCDGTCHNAKHDKCGCMCGGRYHGRRDQAQTELQLDVEQGVWGEELKGLVHGTYKKVVLPPKEVPA